MIVFEGSVAPILVLLQEPEASALHFARLTDRGVPVRRAHSVAEALCYAPETEILITLGPHLGDDAAALFASAPKLRWVQLITTGADNVAEHLDGRRVTLTSTRGLHGAQMSEAALCAMLALSRQLPRAIRNQSDGVWERFSATRLNGKTVGIVGVGAIAQSLAPLCLALGMTVIGFSRSPRAAAGFAEMRELSKLTQAVGDIDHLVLLTPYSAETHHLIDAGVFDEMKPSAFLINIARGGIVDEPALIDALDRGAIAGAALDVFEVEPLPRQNPLWRHPKVLVTPHIGGLHAGYAEDVMNLIEKNLKRYLAEGPDSLINRVDLPGRLVNAAQ
jgi:phosphoglycerate dehydrogenase-like enzyme